MVLDVLRGRLRAEWVIPLILLASVQGNITEEQEDQFRQQAEQFSFENKAFEYTLRWANPLMPEDKKREMIDRARGQAVSLGAQYGTEAQQIFESRINNELKLILDL